MLGVSSVSQAHEQHLQGRRWPGCCRVWCNHHIHVYKNKASETRGIAKILEMVAQTGRRDTENSIILLLALQAGTGLSPANKVLGKESCTGSCLPFEMLSLPMHREIWVKRTCQSWNNLTEILLQKDMLQVGCSG